MVALDTGFFIAMMKGSREAQQLWHRLKDKQIVPLIPSLVVGELYYILLRENYGKKALSVINRISKIGKIIDIDLSIVLKGGEIKDRLKIPYIDSLIGAAAVVNNCSELYTSDKTHMTKLHHYGIKIQIIHE